jgi:outer membrane lipoprotein-sorting protein
MMRGRKQPLKRALTCTILATVAAFSGACAPVKTTTTVSPAAKPVVRNATQAELLEAYNRMAREVGTVNATVQLKPTAGSRYSGVIEEYHEVKAFLLAERPAEIRVIGQAAVIGKTIFDMVSDGETFRVSIPSKNKFLVGAVAREQAGKKPIENLRPQHVLDSLLWTEVGAEDRVLFEEFNDERGRYYILTVLRGTEKTEIARKIWFNRADLQVSRLQSYGPEGTLLSDVQFSDWQPLVADQELAAGSPGGPAAFPRKIRIERPNDDYTLNLEFTKLLLNGAIPAARFQLEQPAGSELVRVGESTQDKQP